MINTKLTDGTIPNLTSPASTDLLYVVDVSDSTDDPAGTSKAITYANLLKATTDRLDAEHNSDGTHSDITATSVTATTGTYTDIVTGSMDASGAVSGNTITADSSVIADTISEKTASTGVTIDGATIKDGYAPSYDSMARQAIMNGNFDIWQRAGSSGLAWSGNSKFFDRWKNDFNMNGGTLPSGAAIKTEVIPGQVDGAHACAKIYATSAGDVGNSGYAVFSQAIDQGTRYLCGAGKTVTLSFWAKSDIANKRLGVYLNQAYGSGGTATEILKGRQWTLTSTWTKYTYTFTTNTLVGKTFGGDGRHWLGLYFATMWGTTWSGLVFDSGTTEENFGNGYVQIAQVQLCAGDVALPFQPKPWMQEFQDCKQFYQKSYNYEVAPGTNTSIGAARHYGSSDAGGNVEWMVELQTNMAYSPTVTWIAADGTADKWNYWRDGAAAKASVTNDTGLNSTNRIYGYCPVGANWVVANVQGHWTADAEL